MADQPDEPMDLTDLTLPARKSKKQKQREYRQRIAASKTSAQVIAERISAAERMRDLRQRKAVYSLLVSGSLESTTASSSRSGAKSSDVQTGTQRLLRHQKRQTSAAKPAQITVQPGTSSDQIEVQQAQSTWITKWAFSIKRFKSTFLDNDFGYVCSVCDRLWFKNDLKPITAAQLKVISEWFIKKNRRLCREEYKMVCNNCKNSLSKKMMPLLAKVKVLSYPDQPPGLPPLEPISEQLTSPRLPFKQVGREIRRPDRRGNSRKRDLFAIIRQLGKPTVFLTISANEIRWMNLLTILLKLSKKYPGKTAKDLNTSERCTLVSDDPFTCCIYFYRLVGSLLKMLKSKQYHNPFGKYFVKDYFLRIEFQHGGSPRAHILLWLNDDPRETVSENMPRTIDLVEKLCSVDRDDVPNNSVYANQIHKHTFTCTKRGETTCRFGIPYWPMPTTRVLVPIPQSDGRRQTLQQKAKELRTYLGECRYACMDEFLNANGLTYVSYLDIVRSTLRRPTLVFRRNFDELMTNTFNPYLAGEVNSNIDIQFILDDYSCAEYVVEYVNKSARGMGNLRREVTMMLLKHPNHDYRGILKAFSKLLNAVEMSAQEAAWFVLRQPMSESSRQVVYIPTVWPTERQRCRKSRQQMDREGIDGDSTDVWTKNIIQRYEERPASLEQVYLAEFASWYAYATDFVDEEDSDDDDDIEAVPEARAKRASKEYRRRLVGRVIRYRRHDIDETVNYKREMVLLYVQFRNEMSEIIDQNKFLQLFDDNKDTIMERRNLFETNLNIENVIKELEAMMILQNDDNSNQKEGDGAENVDDVNQIVPRQGFSIVKKRSNMMIKQQYCELTSEICGIHTNLKMDEAHELTGKNEPLTMIKNESEEECQQDRERIRTRSCLRENEVDEVAVQNEPLTMLDSDFILEDATYFSAAQENENSSMGALFLEDDIKVEPSIVEDHEPYSGI